MLLRWQKLLDSSTHILNLIHWMPYFRAKFAVLSSKAWSLVHSVQWWFGKDERFCFSVKYRTCPFLKRLESVKWIKQHRKNRPHVEEESQKSDSVGPPGVGQLRLCVCCFKTQFGNLNWMDNNRKHLLLRRRVRERRCQCWVRADLSLHLEELKELNFFNSLCSPCGTILGD